MIGYCHQCRHSVPATAGDAGEFQCSVCGSAIAVGDDETRIPVSSLRNISPPSDPGSTPPETLEAPPREEPGRRRPLPRDFGDYQLLEEIGHGGMGVVYKARHIPLDRILALKMIRSAEFASSSDVERFRVEAAAAARLDHPSIVAVHEFGEIDGQHYFTMGFVEGGSLQQMITDVPLPARDAAGILKTIADAVQYAHERGIIHRDLKPSNVLIGRDGKPRVTDFGLAKRIEADSQLTETGQILGTPSYMPPEQTRGENVGPYSDVYSLGAVLYTMLTCRPPFQGANPIETIRQVQDREPELPRKLNPNVDRELETVCIKCLEKDPALRYGTAGELAAELDRFLKHEPIKSRPASAWRRSKKWIRRHPMAAAMIALSATACLVVAGLVAHFQGREGEKQAELDTEREARLKEQAKNAAFVREIVRLTDLERAGVHDLLDADLKKRLDNSLKHFEGMLPTLRGLSKSSDDRDAAQSALAACLFNIGSLRLTLGRGGPEESLKAARALYEELHNRFPKDIDHLRGFLSADYNLAESLGAKRDYKGSLRFLDEALAKVTPTILRADGGLVARLYLSQGLASAHLTNLVRAEKSLIKAQSLLLKEVESNPDDPLMKSRLGRAQFALGVLSVRKMRYIEAKPYYEKAVAAQQYLVRRYGSGNASIYRRDLIHSLTNYGLLLWQLNEMPAAERPLQQAADEARFLVNVLPSELTYGELARAVYHLASFKSMMKKPGDTRRLLQEALAAFAKVKDTKREPDLLFLQREARIALMRLHLRDGEHAAAFKLIQLLSRDVSKRTQDYIQGATLCAQCANLAVADKTLDDTERAAVVKKYAQLAAELLTAAAKLGFDQFEQSFRQAEWKSLRERPEFQAFLKQKASSRP